MIIESDGLNPIKKKLLPFHRNTIAREISDITGSFVNKTHVRGVEMPVKSPPLFSLPVIWSTASAEEAQTAISTYSIN